MSRRAIESPDGGPNPDEGDRRGSGEKEAALLRINREVFEIMSWRRTGEDDEDGRSFVGWIGDWGRSDE